MRKIVRILFDYLYKLNPKLSLKVLYRIKMKRKLNLKFPELYTEKIQWIKLNDKNPLMPMCCDKFHVREYVSAKGLNHLLIDLYWQGFNSDEIHYHKLPSEFIIKATHGAGFNIICVDKKKLDKAAVSVKLRQWLNQKYVTRFGEWFYGVKQPRIIIEQLLKSEDGSDLRD